MWRAPLRGHARPMARCGPGCTYSALSHTGRLCKVVPPAATPRRTHITRTRSLRIGGIYGGAKKGGKQRAPLPRLGFRPRHLTPARYTILIGYALLAPRLRERLMDIGYIAQPTILGPPAPP